MNASVCLLVIGDLGSAGKLSISTLERINPSRICIASNPSGKKWLLSVTSESLVSKFCFHDDIAEKFEFEHVQKKSSYSEYRSKDFRILTLLKWDLLFDSLHSHPESKAVLFSDLDVYWMDDPDIFLSRLEASTSLMYVQDDASELRPSWCCTGVMFWKNSAKSQVMIKQLREIHQDRINNGCLQDDEDTFNQYVREFPNSLAFERLPKEQFLVGRHFKKILFPSETRDPKFCFHANYLTGLNRKFDSLKAIDEYTQHGKFPLKELIKFLSIPMFRRIKNGIKRRVRRK